MAHVVMNMYVSIVKVRDHEDERVHPSGAAFEVEVQIGRHDQAGMAVTIDGISDPELTRHALLPILQVLQDVYPEKFVSEPDDSAEE